METTSEIKQTKICSKCGRELPLDHFYNNKSNKDGKQYYCKQCTADNSAHRKRVRVGSNVVRTTKVYDPLPDPDSPLAKFTPRELIAELRKRGYTGSLRVVQEINV